MCLLYSMTVVNTAWLDSVLCSVTQHRSLRLRGRSMVQSLAHLITHALSVVTSDGFMHLFHLCIICVICNVISFQLIVALSYIIAS